MRHAKATCDGCSVEKLEHVTAQCIFQSFSVNPMARDAPNFTPTPLHCTLHALHPSNAGGQCGLHRRDA